MTITYDSLLVEERPGVLTFGGARMTLFDVEAGFWALRRQMETLVGPRLADDVLQQAGANGGASFARAFAGEGAARDAIQALRDCIAAYQAAGFGQFEIVEAEWPLGRVLVRARDSFEAWTARRHGDQTGGPVCAYTAGVLVGFVNVLAGRQDVVCAQRTCQGQGAPACLFELLPATAAADGHVVAFDPDPALGRQLNLLELLFERMPMGIAIFDRDYRIRRYNPTWAEFADRYAPPSAAPIAPGAYYFDLLPGTEPTVLPLFELALAGETVRLESVRLESEGIVTYWDVVLAPITERGAITGILNVTIDATDRVQAHQELETTLETLRQREERLSLVMEGINDGIWDWDVESGEIYLSPRWKSMLGYTEAEIPDEFESWQKLIHPSDRKRAEAALQEHLEGRAPLYRLEHRLRHKDGDYRWILARGKALRYDDGTAYRLVGSHTDITERVMAQRHLERRVEERTRELSTLLEVSHNVNSTLDLRSLLDLILDQLRTVVEYTGASILTLDDGHLSVQAYRGPIPQEEALALRFPMDRAGVNRQVIRQRKPLFIADIRGDTRLARMFRRTAGDELDSVFGYVRSWLGVPLTVKGEVLGMLTLDHSEPGFFAAHRAGLVQTFANQVAVALENARLYAHAEESAVAAERSRLARDLHDAVTQSLFSSSLIAEVLPRIWQRDPDEGRRRLDELRELTRGALAEMRTLLLELRPAALEEANLRDLLRQLTESITGRARVPVSLEIEGECQLEPVVKVTLYRIAQEALNNVAKHAGATAATLRLTCQPDHVALCVHDDGLGFDPARLPANSLGLGIMRERAEAIGADLTIDSQPGSGTKIDVTWRSPDP